MHGHSLVQVNALSSLKDLIDFVSEVDPMEGADHLSDVQLDLLFNVSPHSSEERYELIWKGLCTLLKLTVVYAQRFIRLQVSSYLHEDFPSNFTKDEDHEIGLHKSLPEFIFKNFDELCR